MKKHIYYKIELRLASPMSLGSGLNNESDHDVVRKKDGTPFIPATSVAGVFRHVLDDEKALQNKLFGSIDNEESHGSQIIFYDAELVSESAINIRDSVKLEKKVGVKGAKFDMEIVETGAVFLTYLELADAHEETIKNTEKMLSMLSEGILRFGTKTSRGYGKVCVISMKKAEFDIDENPEDWLDFDVFSNRCWNGLPEFSVESSGDAYTIINMKLRQNGAVSIREYLTDVGKNNESMPDYRQMSLSNGTSVISGTSWAGAFRDRFREFSDEESANLLFGYIDEETDTCKKSRIVFSESIIKNDKLKTITRNSIDRFSSMTKNAALYTELTCYNGETELEILLGEDVSSEERTILSAVILDLSYGYLAVGGLTAIGRGMFTVEGISVNGEDRTEFLDPDFITELLEV